MLYNIIIWENLLISYIYDYLYIIIFSIKINYDISKVNIIDKLCKKKLVVYIFDTLKYKI